MDETFLRRLKYRRPRHEMDELISLQEYGEKYGYSEAGVHYLRKTLKVIAYKISHRWWVVDEPPPE